MKHALTIALTGATGGIGQAIAQRLATNGHRLILIGRNQEKLEQLRQQLRQQLSETVEHLAIAADLLDRQDRARIVERCRELDSIDALINNAGVSRFALLQDSSDEDIQAILNTNVLAPMLLARDFLPLLQASDSASVINVGSTFGTIGYAGFSPYSASKFGLRGFTEALRRELADTSIAVHYLAPRAVDTTMNSAAVVALNKQLGNAMDTPDIVANACHELLTQRRSGNRYLGWPERFFVKLNALLPRLVDGALRKQLPTIQQHCRPAN